MSVERSFDGIGRQAGRLRPDFGPDFAELVCDQCNASWVGPVLEPCRWCARSLELVIEWQAELVLRPPETPVGDRNYEPTMSAWQERLHRAVVAGLIDRQQASSAWRRAVTCAA